MAGPNMEVFKFGFYLFFPIYVMFKFGDPVWYNDYVQPYKEMLWPAYELTNKPPKTSTDLHQELARLKAERRARAGQISQSSDTMPDQPAQSHSDMMNTSLEQSRTLQMLEQAKRPSPPPDAQPPRTDTGQGRWDWVDQSSERLV